MDSITKINRRLHLLPLGLLVLVAIALAPPAIHLARTALHDEPSLAPTSPGHAEDASRLNATPIFEIWHMPTSPQAAEQQLVKLLERARRDQLPVTIAGAKHSMGGHTIARDGIVIDMLPFRAMALSPDKSVLSVQAGALWADIIPFLDSHGRSVAIMQSDNSFSVGGSLSVNVHGWQAKRPPIAASVKSFRLVTADGQTLRCSRTENPQLFALALGGYGLFGIILDAELWTVPNEWYEVENYSIPVERYAEIFRHRVDHDSSVEMVYTRLRVTQKAFLDEAILTVYRKTNGPHAPLAKLEASHLDPLRRAIFRGSIESDYGKMLRWHLEKIFGEKIGHDLTTRNQLLNGHVALYSNRNESRTDIIQEYFLPPNQLAAFLLLARKIIPQHNVDLLNVTLRDVRQDNDTLLRYADQDVTAVVMLFNQARTQDGESSMSQLTRKLIDASLRLGGRYYLPYRPHATFEQFIQAYPQAREFAMLKQQYDSGDHFRNQFYLKYVSPLLADSRPPHPPS